MAGFVERRKYRRFEIPEGTAKIGKIPGNPSYKPFSGSCPLLNVCIEGVNILCSMAISAGENLLFELHAPGEDVIKLRARVVWTNPVPLSKDILAGFKLFPFGEDKDQNPPEAMGVLRRLYARYIEA